MGKRYYWLKLYDNFFQQKTVKKLRRAADGDTCAIIYLKMLLTAMKTDGKLCYEGVEDTFAEELALELDEELDKVEATVAFLLRYGLMTACGPAEYLLEECARITGSESDGAERMRKMRKASQCDADSSQCDADSSQCDADSSQCDASPSQCSTMCNNVQKCDVEIEKEIDIDKEIEKTARSEPKDSEPEAVITIPLNTGEEFPLYQKDIDEFAQLYPALDIMQEMRNIRGWCINNPKKRKTKSGVRRFVNSWLARDQDKGGGVQRPAARPNSFNNFDQRDNDCEAIQNELIRKSMYGGTEGTNGRH